jgi:hypothetical protein
MARTEGSAPIVLNFSTTEAEYRGYVRAVWKRQARAVGQGISWSAYLGVIPVGLLGGFAAIGLGVPGEYGARIAMLIGIAYMLGQAALHLASRVYATRVGRIDQQNHLALKVTIDEKGVTSQRHTSSTYWSWEDITDLTREEGLLMFWLGPSRAIPVPSRALAATEEPQILRMAKARISPKPDTK